MNNYKQVRRGGLTLEIPFFREREITFAQDVPGRYFNKPLVPSPIEIILHIGQKSGVSRLVNVSIDPL